MMKRRVMNYVILLALAFLFGLEKGASGCTSFCFCAGDTVLFGNTLDWYIGDGLVVINKRNVSKTAIWYPNPAKWTSKYGSVTINQWGREFPSRGMNEAGLVVGEMTLSETHFPAADSRPSISLLQWIQYQLDNCATVDEVIECNSRIRIDPEEYHSHFLVADSTGNAITMEWLNGRLVYHTRETLPVKALTNSTYSSSIAFYQSGRPPSSGDFSSLARFYRVASLMDLYSANLGPAVQYAWSILTSIKNGNWTKWSLLFDVRDRRFYFRTAANPNVRFVDMDQFDFSCTTPVKILDLNTSQSGDVSSYFIDYDYTLNVSILKNSAEKLAPYVGSTSEWAVERMARYPETTIYNPDSAIRNSGSRASGLELYPNYPNPFNAWTTISYTLSESDFVTLKVLDALGWEVRTLVNEVQPKNKHRVTLNANGLASGVYLYRLNVGRDFSETRKMLFMK